MRFLLFTLAAMAGCQPIQTAPVATPPLLFAAPQPVAPLQNSTLLQPFGGAAPVAVSANPLYIPVTNQDWAWEQIVDVIDNYFRVERENRVQLIGNVMTEGRIDTFPQIGATWLEPHRPDSVGAENRWESTLQTIRRRAVLRVIPEQGGYLVDVAVIKELEDLPRPEHSTTSALAFRHDNSLESRLSEDVLRTRLSKSWLPLGRDLAIEQQILAEIQARVAGQ